MEGININLTFGELWEIESLLLSSIGSNNTIIDSPYSSPQEIEFSLRSLDYKRQLLRKLREAGKRA